jgi:hypothetical protein
MSPGHLDQHLTRFTNGISRKGGWIARPPGIAQLFLDQGEQHALSAQGGRDCGGSGTYNDFTTSTTAAYRDGRTVPATSPCSPLEVLDELRLLQPQAKSAGFP